MPYELRIKGRAPARFETEPEAVEAARDAIRADADCEPELIDLATGRPGTPGASQAWRDELKGKVGF